MTTRKSSLLIDFKVLLCKDLFLLARGREFLWALLFVSLLLVTTTSASLSLAWLEPEVKQRLFPPLLWLIFLLSCVTTLEKAYEKDAEENASAGLFLTGVSPSIVYLAKVCALTLSVSLSHLLNLILLAVFLAVPLSLELLLLIPLSFPVIFGFSALATIVQPMSVSSRLGGLLLPLLLLPLLFPLFFAASSLSTELLLGSGNLVGSFSLTLLLILDVIYLSMGINLYEFVIRG